MDHGIDNRTRESIETQLALFERTHRNDVIAAGPFVKDAGAYPCRIVLRSLGSQWVIHEQIVPTAMRSFRLQMPYFAYGVYISKSRDGAFEKAWKRFEERCRNHLRIYIDDYRTEPTTVRC